MATRVEIGDLLQVLHALYPHSSPMPKGLSEQALADAVARVARPWHTILGDLPVEVLSLAVKELASSNREFFPPAGVVRQAALDLMGAAGAEKTVGEAWEEVRLALSRGEHAYRKGYYQWSSDLVERAFKGVGGWQYFNEALMESVMADRAHFMRVYGELLEREEKERREAPAVTAFRRMLLGDQRVEDRSKRPRMIAVDVEEEWRRLATNGGEQDEVQGLLNSGEDDSAEDGADVAEAIEGMAAVVFTAAIGNPDHDEYGALVQLGREAQAAGAYFGYHAYWPVFYGESFVDDTSCQANLHLRWNAIDNYLCAQNIKVRWLLTEAGPIGCNDPATWARDGYGLRPADGWKLARVWNGDLRGYIEDLTAFDELIARTKAAREGRFKGYALFTSNSCPGEWAHFNLVGGDAERIAEYTARAEPAPEPPPARVWVRPDAAPYLRFRALPWGPEVARLLPGAGPFQVVGREGPWVQLAAYAHGDFLTGEEPDELG